MLKPIIKVTTAILIAVFFSANATAQDGLKSGPVALSIESAELGNTKNVHRSGNLYFAGQCTPDDVELMVAGKFKRVISLRTPGEIDWDEAAAIKAAGIQFIEVPFRAPDTMTDEVIERVRKLLQDKSQKTLFHCGSANRVGGVWLPFRVLDEGVELEKAIAEAKKIGLRNNGYQVRAIEYIQSQAAKKPKEESVKPGINQGFKNPELNVDDYIKRFEVESREVYLCRDKIIEATGVKAGDRIADVGAGTGLFTRLFSEVAGDEGWVYAVDIAPRFVEHIRTESQKLDQENVSPTLCDEDSVNLPSESVDLVFICDTYHHFEYPKSTMASIHRALKPDGRLVLIDFERIPGKTREWLMDHVRGGKEVFRSEVQDSGFTLVEEKKLEGFEENYFLVFRKD